MDEKRKVDIECWVRQNYPQIQYTPCEMPEVLGGERYEIVKDTVLATTTNYIIFYKDKGHDSAYRQYYNGKWSWVVDGVPRHVSDEDVVAFIEKLH